MTEPLNLDPLASPLTLASPSSGGFPVGDVFSGLVRVADLVSEDDIVEPDLARSWRVSSDGRVFTFALRENLRFSDGTPLVASDVKWSWERALTRDYSTTYASVVLGDIVGARRLLDGDTDVLEGVTVLDDETLRVELSRPVAHFLMLLSDPVASVLSRRNFEAWGTLNWVAFARTYSFRDASSLEFDALPVGTGPFMVESFREPKTAVLTPNLHYWRGPPDVERIELADFADRYPLDADGNRHIPLSEYDWMSADEQMVALIDAGHPPTISGESVKIFEPLVSATAPRVSFLALNTSLAPFDDVEFRLALLHSADRRNPGYTLINSLPRGSADGILPPGFPGHVSEQFEFSPTREVAQGHLSRSRYEADGETRELVFLHRGGGWLLDNLRVLGRRWSSWLGISVRDPDSPKIPITEFNEALADGTLQMRYVHVEPRYPDPCAILCRIPDLFGPNARSDETELLREMLHDAAATADRAARIAKYQAIEAHILDRALVIPAYWDDGTVYELVKPYISGYKIPAYGGSRYEDVVVDTTHPDYPAGR